MMNRCLIQFHVEKGVPSSTQTHNRSVMIVDMLANLKPSRNMGVRPFLGWFVLDSSLEYSSGSPMFVEVSKTKLKSVLDVKNKSILNMLNVFEPANFDSSKVFEIILIVIETDIM